MKRFFTLVIAIAAASCFSMRAEERLVVVEVFTSATCPPCAPAAPIIHRNVGLDKGCVAIKHQVWWPGPTDPFYNSSEEMKATIQNRASYYGVQGVPDAFFDGKNSLNPNDEPGFIKNIADARKVVSPLKMSVTEDRSDASNIKVTVKVANTGSTQLTDQKLRVAVVYNQVVIPGYPGITNGMTEFFDVLYKILPAADGENLTLQPNEEKVFTYTYTPGTGALWPKSQNYVIAYVQDPSSKTMQQGATNKGDMASVNLSAASGGLFENNQTITKVVTVSNPGNNDLNVNLSIDATSSIPNGWQASFEKETVTVPANGSANVNVIIVTNGNAGFLDLQINGAPQSIGFGGKTSISGLSTNAKYVIYGGTNSWSGDMLGDMNNMVLLNNRSAMIPLSNANISLYPPANFDVSVFTTDQANRGALAVNATTMNAIREAVGAGKKVLVSSSLDLYNAFSSSGSVPSQMFFQQDLGIANGGNPIQRFTQSGNTVTFNSFPLKGVAGDPVSNGIDLTLNTNIGSTTKLSTNYYTDIIRIDNEELAKPIFTFESASRIGGIRVENGDSRTVYLSFGLEAIADASNRKMVMERCIAWLLGSPLGVNDNTGTSASSISITPNTVVDEAVLRYAITGSKQDVNISLYDVLGNKARNLGTFSQAAGTYELPVKTNMLANGAYYIVVKTNSQTLSSPLSILR